MTALSERRKCFVWRACTAFVREQHPQMFEAIRTRAVELFPYLRIHKGRRADTFDSLMKSKVAKGSH